MERRRQAVILAAGDGKRMKSDQPKVLCQVLGRPMLTWVEEVCRQAGIQEIIVVAGDRPELLRPAVSESCRFVQQRQRLGTGHAVLAARELLDPAADVAVVCGDAPLLRPEDLKSAHARHQQEQNAVTLLCARLEDPTGYGRVVRRADGGVDAIVEERDASASQRQIQEVNSGAYWFSGAFLRDALPQLTAQNAQGEYYLTDTVALAVGAGLRAGAYLCPQPDAALGANSRRQLQQLNGIARRQVLDRHLENGVDIPLEDGILIGPQVRIGPDTQILPGTILEGETSIGPGCVIGPNSMLKNTTVGAFCQIKASWLTDSTVGDHTTIGPFSQLRPGSHVGDHVKIGDFVELKNTSLGDHTSVAHLTYLGDSQVGEWCNFGCGVVVANYDGNHKYRTVVGDRVFVGCNTNLVPPVTLGDGSYTAAGTTVDQDVPAGALAIGRVRQENKPGWADEHVAFKKGPQPGNGR